MNNDVLRRAAASIAAEPEAFDLSDWVRAESRTVCGYVACVAGHIVANERPELWAHVLRRNVGVDVGGVATELLGLGGAVPDMFFDEVWWYKALASLELLSDDQRKKSIFSLLDVTAKQAAEVLLAIADGDYPL